MNINHVGQSEETLIKQAHYSKILGAHLRIGKGVINKNTWVDTTYYHIDICSGSGDLDNELHGSPIQFMDKAVKEKNIKTVAYFIELNPIAYQKLVTTFKNRYNFKFEQIDDKITVFSNNCHYGILLNEDHKDILKELIEEPLTNKCTIGLLYADPNGDPPFDLIAQFSKIKEHKTLDILIYFSGTTVKRALKAEHTDRKIRINKNILNIHKKDWHIRIPRTKWQWSFLYGTNYSNYPVLKNQDFHHLDSEEGQRILQKIAYTKKELQNDNMPIN